MSLAAFLKYKGIKPLGGVFALSATQALDTANLTFTDRQLQAKRETPMFVYHGEEDPMIPFENA